MPLLKCYTKINGSGRCEGLKRHGERINVNFFILLNVLFRKYRLVKRETPTVRRTKVKNELRLQRNESLLAVPYLTQVGLKVPSFKSQV